LTDARVRRFAIVLQTPKDPQSAIYIGYGALAGALRALGHHVDIVAPGDFPATRRLAGRWVPLLYPFVVAQWMRTVGQHADVVVFHSYAGWRCRSMRGGRGPRAVLAFHGLEPLYHAELRAEADARGRPLSRRYRLLQERLMPIMLQRGCRKATAVTCLNRHEADFLGQQGWVPPADIHVMPHGIPPVFFAPPRAASGARTWLFVGQWLPMKGIAYLRDAMAALMERIPDLGLVCAGTLADERSVRADFPIALRSRVAVYPRIAQDDLADLYRRVDAFVFPSLYEGFSRALVEAMAAGLPIVTTNVGVAADALRDGLSALVVPPRDAASIVAAVERLRHDPALAVRLGAAARMASEDYHLDQRQHQMIDFLLDLAGRR